MSRVGKLALVAVAVPVASRVLRRVGQQIQERRGNGQISSMHRHGHGMASHGHRHW